MKKTTEELADESGIELQEVVGITGNRIVLTAGSIPFASLETFRTLVIQNERESAEPVAWMGTSGVGERIVSKTAMFSWQNIPLFTFPPALQHTLYKDCEANIPTQIVDRNGQVTLGLCKVCGKAESELTEPCHVPAHQPCQSAVDALEALDNMDDYARMQIGVDAIGPRKVLEDYIKQPCPICGGKK